MDNPNIIPISPFDSVSPEVEYVKTEHVLKNIKPVYVAGDVLDQDMNTGESVSKQVKIKFFEPEKKEPSVPYIPYNEQHNPWNILEAGQSTDHLYH